MGRHRAKVGQRGFTLLELIVTLVVLAVAIALVAPAIGRSTEAIRARAEVARFSALLRHTREQAISTRRPHSLTVDPAGHRVAIAVGDDEARETRALPADLVVEADPPAALTVRFEPHGVSNGGNFRVTTGAVRHRVRVEGLTGRVKVTRE